MPADRSAHWSHVTKRALELAGTDWQPIDHLITNLIPLVPPGQAIRASRAATRPIEDQVLSGARRTVWRAVNMHVKAGRLEVAQQENTSKILVRRVDLCPVCSHPFVPRPTAPVGDNVLPFLRQRTG